MTSTTEAKSSYDRRHELVWKKLTFSPITTGKIRVTVNSALNGRSRIVEVEAFAAVAPPRTNVALAASGATASASSSTPDTEIPGMEFQPSSINDGNRAGSTYPHNAFWRDGTNNAWPDWVQIDFNGSKTIDEIDVFSVQDTIDTSGPVAPTETMTFSLHGITGFDVQYWNGASWVTVSGGSISGNNKVWKKLTFTPITTSKIRVSVNAALNGRSRVVELEAWGTAAAPRTNVSLASCGAAATASSTTPDTEFPGMEFQPGSANDGNRSGSTYPHNAFWRDGTNNVWPDWLQVDFNGSKTIDEIDVIGVQDTIDTTGPIAPTEAMTFSLHGITAFNVQYWDGSAWVTVPGGSVTGNNKVWRKFTFAAITTSKIRVTVNGALNSRSRLVELEAWGTAAAGSSGANLNWLVTDQLGTPRMVIDKAGSLASVKRHDYLPFGEELFSGQGTRSMALGYTGDPVRQKFTSYERDTETNLDFAQARYYASTQGRFTSVDPLTASAMTSNPQTFNRYSYVTNSPLRLIDPSGMFGISPGGSSQGGFPLGNYSAEGYRSQPQPQAPLPPAIVLPIPDPSIPDPVTPSIDQKLTDRLTDRAIQTGELDHYIQRSPIAPFVDSMTFGLDRNGKVTVNLGLSDPVAARTALENDRERFKNAGLGSKHVEELGESSPKNVADFRSYTVAKNRLGPKSLQINIGRTRGRARADLDSTNPGQDAHGIVVHVGEMIINRVRRIGKK